MKPRSAARRTIKLSENTKKLCAILDGDVEPNGVFQLSEDDMRSMHIADEPVRWNAFFSLFHRLLSEGRVKPGVKIELTEHAAGISFAGIGILEQYVLERGFPQGVKISVAVNDDSHPMIKIKAIRLARMFSHHDPYERLVAYMRKPESDTYIYISKLMRERYDAEHGNLIEQISELIKLQRIPPRCSFVFRAIQNQHESRMLEKVIKSSKLPTQFDLFIPARCQDGSDIADVQCEIYDIIQGKKIADDRVAFAVLMSGRFFDETVLGRNFINQKIQRTVCHKAVTEKIYHYANGAEEKAYVKSATLQHDRIKERVVSRKRWSLFTAATVVTGFFALGLVSSSLMKNSK